MSAVKKILTPRSGTEMLILKGTCKIIGQYLSFEKYLMIYGVIYSHCVEYSIAPEISE